MDDQILSDISAEVPIVKGLGRVESIDILRAATMVLMIFVNDLGSLKEIPEWLDHVKPGVDGIGLADTVFPAFLFIVGMSLPYAVENRRLKGDSETQLIQHVIYRTIALLIMGVFLVNGETISKKDCGLGYINWSALSCLAFILIWNAYPKRLNNIFVYGAKGLGISLLILLAFIYRGSENGVMQRFSPQWWGILGLIGWSYLTAGLITVFSKNRVPAIIAACIFFAGLSILYALHIIGHNHLTYFIPDPIIGGTLVALVLGGVLLALSFQHFRALKENTRMILLFCLTAGILFALSRFTNKFFIIAKLGATPPWMFLCTAFSILAFVLIYWVADIKNKAGWFSMIKPAGTDTLLCYLIPYFLIFLMHSTNFKLPEPLLTGGVGLLKSLLFALLCVGITYGLNKAGVRLKL